MIDSLPAQVGRVLTAADLPGPERFLIADLVPDQGLTGIAIADSRARVNVGLQLVQALLDGGNVLGRPVVQPVNNVLVLASAKLIGQKYLQLFTGDSRVTIVLLEAWSDTDSDWWGELQRLARDFSMVVVDAANEIAEGNPGLALPRAMASFVPPVIAMYVGYATTQAPDGGRGLWSGATRRWWHEIKTGKLHSLDIEIEPFVVDLSAAVAPAGRNGMYGQARPQGLATTEEAEMVRVTGETARSLGISQGSVRQAVFQLASPGLGGVPPLQVIWGVGATDSQVEAAIGRNRTEWLPPAQVATDVRDDSPPF